MTAPSLLARRLAPLQGLPAPLRRLGITAAVRFAVPFVGTAGIQVERLEIGRGVFTLAYSRKVGNHIGGVHAAAMALLAETATGLVVGMSVPDDKLPLCKRMDVAYVRRCVGGLRADATLSAADIARILAEPKGEVTVPVVVTDDSGQAPIQATMVWAWVPKKR